MSRYIDANKLKKSLSIPCASIIEIGETIIAQIDDQPTADVIEVVRCKDCKYYLNSNEKCELIDTRLRFYETDKIWTEDCFCAWGERAEE